MQEFKFNILKNKLPLGAVCEKQKITYTFEVAQNIPASKVFFVYFKDGQKDCKYVQMHFSGFEEGYKQYKLSIKYPEQGLYWYCFKVENGYNAVFVGGADNNEEQLIISTQIQNHFSQIVNEPPKVDYPKHSGIMYHIFVDRFCKKGDSPLREPLIKKEWAEPMTTSTDFKIINGECYGGNLQGIISKLPYLESLNVKVLYLSPIFYANSNHKYNTADFMQIDPSFGTDEDLVELTKKAKKRGILVVLDGVFNHVGSDSKYFNMYNRFDSVGAYQSQQSPYYNWFNFRQWPDNYECWWDIVDIPNVNDNIPEYRKLITGAGGVIDKYMKLGVGGFRLDVVDELSDDFLNLICKRVYSTKENAFVIGEVWEDASKKIAYDQRRNYFFGRQLNSVTNYPFKNSCLEYIRSGNTCLFAETLAMIKDDYPDFVQKNLMNILGSHDTPRFYSWLKEFEFNEERRFKLFKLATLLQYSYIGMPTVYYGDELLLENIYQNNSRVCFPKTVEECESKNWITFLGSLRNEPAFFEGDINLKIAENGVLCLERTFAKDKYLIATNRNDYEYEFETEELYINILDRTSKPTNIFKLEGLGFAILKRVGEADLKKIIKTSKSAKKSKAKTEKVSATKTETPTKAPAKRGRPKKEIK